MTYTIVVIHVIFWLFCVSEYHFVCAPIRTESSINFLIHELHTLDSDSIIIFDLDDTLIQGIAYAPEHIKLGMRKTWYLINKMLEKAHNDAQKVLVYSKLFKMKPDLVEQETPSIIKYIQSKGIKTIGLTASCSGMHYDTPRSVPCNADMRVAHLKLIGIDFQSSFACRHVIVFDDLEKDGQIPAYVNGILFSRPSEKGPVLEAFFDAVGWKPTKIIFIDNLQEMIENVELSAQKMNIPFEGIVFTGARMLPHPDPALFQLRVQYLILYDSWLNEVEANVLLAIPEYMALDIKK